MEPLCFRQIVSLDLATVACRILNAIRHILSLLFINYDFLTCMLGVRELKWSSTIGDRITKQPIAV